MRLWLRLVICFWGLSLNAGDYIEATIQGKSELTDVAEAKREITDQVARQVALQQIEKLLGQAKFKKEQAAIKRRVLKQIPKFIPYVRAGEIKQQGGNFLMPVTVRLHEGSLTDLLTQEGLLYADETRVAMMPWIQMIDRTAGQSYAWWVDGTDPLQKPLKDQYYLLADTFKQAFAKNGFFIFSPQYLRFQDLLPEGVKSESPSDEDLALWTKSLGAKYYIHGQVKWLGADNSPQELSIDLRIVGINSDRELAHFVKSVPLDKKTKQQIQKEIWPKAVKEVADGLSEQVLSYWQKGTLSSQILSLHVEGLKTPLDVENFKQTLQKAVPEIKSIREKEFDGGKISFELQSSRTGEGLALQLKELKNLPWLMNVKDQSEGEITVLVKKR